MRQHHTLSRVGSVSKRSHSWGLDRGMYHRNTLDTPAVAARLPPVQLWHTASCLCYCQPVGNVAEVQEVGDRVEALAV